MLHLKNFVFGPYTIDGDSTEHVAMRMDVELGDGSVVEGAVAVVDGTRLMLQPDSTWATREVVGELMEVVKELLVEGSYVSMEDKPCIQVLDVGGMEVV